MNARSLVRFALTVVLGVGLLRPPGLSAEYEPTAANLEAREWFQDAKFGLFIHWGISAWPCLEQVIQATQDSLFSDSVSCKPVGFCLVPEELIVSESIVGILSLGDSRPGPR